MRIARETGGDYLGDEVSQGDWASRHDRYATPLHGRLRDGTVAPMCWHCEDAAIIYSALPDVRREWHAIAERYIERYGIFDDWGMFFYTNGRLQAVGRLPGRDRHRHLGAAPRRRDLGGLGRVQAGDRRGVA